MKPLALATALLGLAASALASSHENAARISLSPSFKPPQVFKNVNLVHIVSLEKNYAKENINVLVENISSEPQDEYFLPFSASQISRIGGFEVKDRKDDNLGLFQVDEVSYDDNKETQYYLIRLPVPLKPGAQQTLGISFYHLKSLPPLPASIAQDDKQYLTFDFSAYCPSAYVTTKQKTEVKCYSSDIPDYTTIGDFPKKQGSKLTYGPFEEQPAGASHPIHVRFEFTKPVIHVAGLTRDIEVSHWGGNVAFEDHFDLFHRGANLSSHFDRVKWVQGQYYNPATYAIKELRFPLRVGSVDAYYTDVIGNVSTSKFRSNNREAVLETKPRYPIFGGWKYPFTVGWNSDAKNFLRRTGSGSYVLNVPFLEGPKQVEGVEYEDVLVKVLLPEGAENIKWFADIPSSSVVSSSVETEKTYLDTVGRTALIIRARNLFDEFRDRELVVTYDYSLMSALRKPAVVFSAMLSIVVATWLVGGLNVGFSTKK